MRDNKRQNLSVNERKIAELTLQGESQIAIANKLDVAKNELQKLEEAKEGVTVIKVKYSDTDAMFDKQVKNALREFGIPEDVIQQ